jgi:hypothetical protein
MISTSVHCAVPVGVSSGDVGNCAHCDDAASSSAALELQHNKTFKFLFIYFLSNSASHVFHEIIELSAK